MTTFRVLSDLHLEHYYNKSKICKFKIKKLDNQIRPEFKQYINMSKNYKVDYLILAGDIVDYPNREIILPEFINSIKKYYKQIFYILGNHEYYGTRLIRKKIEQHEKKKNREVEIDTEEIKSLEEQVISEYRQICNSLDITFLENDEYEISDKISIFGCTLWTNIEDIAYKRMTDRLYLTPEEIRKMHNFSREKIKHLIETQLEKKSEKKIIIITHHLPSYKLINRKYDDDITNSAFASNCDDLFIAKNISYWIFGHSHIPIKRKLKNIFLMSNPIGYPEELYKKDEIIQDCIFHV